MIQIANIKIAENVWLQAMKGAMVKRKLKLQANITKKANMKRGLLIYG
jgi:hypothetical protein